MKNISNITSFNYIHYLFKLAAKDIPDFYPGWVKEHHLLKRYETLSEITKKIPVEEYRESVDAATDLETSIISNLKITIFKHIKTLLIVIYHIIEEWIDNCANIQIRSYTYGPNHALGEFKNILVKIKNEIDRIKSNSEEISSMVSTILETKKVSSSLVFKDSIESKTFKVKTPAGEFPKQFKYQPGSIDSVMKRLTNDFNRYVLGIDDGIKDLFTSSVMQQIEKLNNLSEFDSFKKISDEASWSLKFLKDIKTESFEVVFSKQAADLLGMSIRANWTSCQNLLKDRDRYNYKAIHAAIQPYVGIIYLTNKKDWESRGEHMVARALVFYLLRETDNSPIIAITDIYCPFKSSVESRAKMALIFQDSLKRHSSLPVEILTTFEKIEDYFLPYEELDMEPSPHGTPIVPYMDEVGLAVKLHPDIKDLPMTGRKSQDHEKD